MSFSGYPTYKNSGVDWLGEVPSHWDVRRLGGLFTERREKVSDTEFPPLSVTKRGIVPQLETAAKTDDNDNRKCVLTGDFVINSRSDRKGSSGLSLLDGSVSLINTVITADERLEPTFVHYLLRSEPFQEEFYRYGKGIVADLWSTNYAEMKNIVLAYPDRAEQRAIAAFLDRETAKIDALVEEQRRLIALLKEKRQAVISNAVTKGLNPDVPMKDSGVEWLGQVPAHWAVAPTGNRYEVQLGRMLNAERASGEDLRPYLRVADVQWGSINVNDLPLMDFPPEARAAYRLRAGDLLVNEGGSYVGRSAIWQGELDECYYQKALHRVRPRSTRSDTSDFLLFVMEWATNFGLFVARGNQTTIDHLTAEQLRAHRFAFPPIHEQHEISAHLQRVTSKFEALRLEADSAIALLGERRAALISAAVTGKIDVRGTAKVLPFPVGRARARGLVAAEIIERSAHQATFGRVKLQKIAYLAEVHAGVAELEGLYLREAAGPLDRDMIREMEREAGALGGVRVDQPDGAGSIVTYRLGDGRGAHRQDLAALLGDRAVKFDKLIEDIGTIDTKGAEAVATLYAVWNDALIDGDTPSDMEIKLAVLSEWHPEKAEKFTINELQIWLDWMRRHGIVPTGAGPKTTTGRLFA